MQDFAKSAGVRLLSEGRERLRALFFRAREERELDEELRSHIEMEIAANVGRGMSPEEARRQALIAFGGVEQFKEEVRDARRFGVLEDVASDLRWAVRRLTREPGYTVPAVMTLALGIGVTAAVFGLVNAVLIRPLPYPEADRLVVIRHAASRMDLPMNGVSPGIANYYRAHNRVFEDIGVYVEHPRTLTDLSEPEQVRSALVTPGLVTVMRPAFALPPAAGGIDGVCISHALWVRRYGADPGIVGRTIRIGDTRRGVSCVLARGFQFPHPDTDVWDAWHSAERAENTSRASLRFLAYGGIARLRPATSLEEAERDLERLVRALPEAFPDVTTRQLEEMGLRAVVLPLKEAIIGDVRIALLLLLSAAAFLLLITWANATNLTLVRAERMRREVAVARALGASDGHLARRFLSESLCLGALGAALGLALATVAIDLRFGYAPDEIPRLREVAVDGAVLALTLGLSIASAGLLGVVALMSARGPNLVSTLAAARSRVTASRREQSGRRLLVAGQVALALTLLIGSALMVRSFWRLKQIDLGFEPQGALTFRLPSLPTEGPNYYHNIARLHDDILRRLRALPGVGAAEAGNIAGFPLTPVPSFYKAPIAAADRAREPADDWPWALFSFATPGYFQAMGIPLVRGRSFRTEDTGRDGHGVILSASLAHALFGDEDPIGRRVRWARRNGEPDYMVVGVAGDVPSESIRDGPARVFYFPNLYPPKADTITGVVHIHIPQDEFYVVKTHLPPSAVVPPIQRAIREVDPTLVMTQVGTLDELVAASMARTRLTMLLLLVAAATALALGMIGIYGVLAYAVSQRTKEIGVRIALGASPDAVVRMVVHQGALLALAGIAVGVLAAWGLARYLRSLLYEVSPSDPVAFAAMTVLLFVVALAASYVPARRAGRIDPVQALKVE
jgi:predicted permease